MNFRYKTYIAKIQKKSARIRKMAEEIQISDIRPIRIKYGKLGASFGTMADDFIPRYKVKTD